MKKNITFINMNIPYDLEADTMIMAAPYTTESIQQILVYDDEIRVRNLTNGDDENNEQSIELCRDSFDDLFKAAHTVVVPDAMFSENSKVFKTEAFMNHGMEALGPFYKKGGRVIVMCIEGVFNSTNNVNRLFGTEWKTKFYESALATPTAKGKRLFGQFLPKEGYYMENNPYFIECPHGEGLFQRFLNDKETFVKNFHAEDETFERLGIEKDESMDCFNVEKSWENYLAKYTDRFCIALHQGKGNEGQVFWFGDRGQSDGVAFVFCKLFNLNQVNSPRRPIKLSYTQEIGEPADIVKKGPSTSFLFSIIIVLFALAARFFGLQ